VRVRTPRTDTRGGAAAGLLSDPAFVRGARSLLSDYARLTTDHSAVFVYDAEVKAVSRALRSIAADAGVRVTYRSAELDWAAIEKHLTVRCEAVLFFESGESHHTQPLLRHLSTSPYAPRAYRLFGATADTIRNGFRRRQATLRRRNWDLIAHARRAGRLIVDSDRGTRLRVGLDRAAGWTNTYGESADGYPGVLPPAEVNTRSADVDGVLVVDGALGSNIGWPLDARLDAHPVALRISHGRITDVDCRQRLVRDLIEEFLRVPQCNEVVEIGIGTNDGIRGFVPSDILLNERVASFHLGVGSADAEIAEQNLHLDFILGDCRILMGSHVALSNGRFAPPTAAVPDRRAYEVHVTLHDAL
jgi:leucyl aminopeptidase (aminopeptidase T)